MGQYFFMSIAFCGLLFAATVSAQFEFGNSFVQTANLFDEAEFVDLQVQLGYGNTKELEGQTPASVVLDRVVSFPAKGGSDLIVLRNLGGKTADLTDWTIKDGSRNEKTFKLTREMCGDLVILPGGQAVEFRPASEENPCGFTFGISYRDTITVMDNNENIVTSASWDKSERGTSFHRLPGGDFKKVKENTNVLGVLESIGGYDLFLEAIEAAGLTKQLSAASDPEYDGPTFPEPPPVEIVPQFPWWFGFSVNRTALPPPPPPPPPPPSPKEGLPKAGPFTLLAPSNEAFEVLLTNLGGFGQSIKKKDFFKFPELKDIMLYHILPGAWTSEFLLNDTSILTAKAVDVTPFIDPPTTEGKVMLHDSCLDKPTPDDYDCLQQVEFDKCYDPFMTSPFGAQWKGGFCEKTCMRCTCDEDAGSFCAEAVTLDLMANNGVVHLIDRVLFPPPKFEKIIPDPALVSEEPKGNLSAEDVRTVLTTRKSKSTQG